MKLTTKLSVVFASTIVGFTGVSISSTAQAAQFFDFEYSFPTYDADGTTISAQGTLTTTDLDPINQNYRILGIKGTRTVKGITETIIKLLSPGTYGNNDNFLNANTPLLTKNGFSYLVTGDGEDGQGNVNVFYSSFAEGYAEFSSDVDFGNFSVTQRSVPEPYTLVGSLVAVGYGWWMKRKQIA